MGFLMELRRSIRQETSEDLHVARESELNIAQVIIINTMIHIQCIARMFIFTNPNLIHDHSKHEALGLLVHSLTNEKTHHELLIFEGLMALTNITSMDESLRDRYSLLFMILCRVISEGGWQNAKGYLFYEKNVLV